MHTTVGILAAGFRQNLVEDSMSWKQSYTANQHGAWISCARCAFRLYYIHRHTARMTSSVDTVIGFSEGGSEANVTFERQRLHGEGGEGHDCRNRGPKASKEETDTTNGRSWTTLERQSRTTISSGNSNAQRNFDTTITSVLSDKLVCGADLLWASSRKDQSDEKML